MFSTQQQKTCQCHLKNHDISVQNTNKQQRGTDVSPPARTYGPSSWKLLRDHYCIHWICSSIPTKLFKREPHKGGIYSRAVIRKVFVSKAQTMHKLAYGAQNNGKNSHAYWVTVYRISCVRAGLSYEKANLRPQFAMSVASGGGSVTAWAQVWWRSLVYRSAASCRGDLRSQINTVKIQMNPCMFVFWDEMFVCWLVCVCCYCSKQMCVVSVFSLSGLVSCACCADNQWTTAAGSVQQEQGSGLLSVAFCSKHIHPLHRERTLHVDITGMNLHTQHF